jgi:hypothetical protein
LQILPTFPTSYDVPKPGPTMRYPPHLDVKGRNWAKHGLSMEAKNSRSRRPTDNQG